MFLLYAPIYKKMHQYLLLSLIVGLTSCGTLQRTVYQVDLPKACRWQSVEVVKHSVSSEWRATDMGPDWRSGYDYFTFEMKSAHDKMEIPLQHALSGLAGETDYRVKVEPNCQGALLSANGQDYYYLGIDAVQPFICQHRIIKGGETIPNADTVAVDILSNPVQHQNDIDKHHQQDELKAAFAHASRTTASLELHWVALKSLKQFEYVTDEMLATVSEWLKNQPDMRDYTFKQARQGVNAYLQLLAQTPNPDYQNLFNDWFNAELNQSPSNESCERMTNFAAALLVETAQLKNGSAKVVASFAKLASHQQCPLLKEGSNPYDHEVWSLRGENSRIWAVKGLLLIRSSAALQVLKQLAKPDCQKYRRVNNQVVSEKWSNFYFQFDLTPAQISNNGYIVTTHERPSLSCFSQIA